jgi:hypothetical protein
VSPNYHTHFYDNIIVLRGVVIAHPILFYHVLEYLHSIESSDVSRTVRFRIWLDHGRMFNRIVQIFQFDEHDIRQRRLLNLEIQWGQHITKNASDNGMNIG